MKKIRLLLVLLCFLSMGVWAQTTITGRVIGADDKQGIPGVSVVVQGSNPIVGTATDINGSYSLNVPDNATNLVFSFMGMSTQSITIGSLTSIDVIMSGSVTALDAVVVTGYGNVKKSVYSGAASVIDSKKINDIPALSMNSLLQGNASGLTVTTSGGSNQPGSGSEIRIRGLGSINASQNPLYVVDGVPVISGDVSAIDNSYIAGLDVMSTLNTSDIENITIIKDAAAAALYGSRAANGVILITTKSGKKGKPTFNLRSNVGFSDFAMPFRAVMNGQDRRDKIIEGYRNEQLLKGITDEGAIQTYIDANIDKTAPIPWCGFVNWDEILFQKGSFQNYEASVSGGTDAITTYASLGYTDQEGITANSGLKRLSGKFNVDWNLTKKFTVGLKTLMSSVNQDVFIDGTDYSTPTYSSRSSVTPSDPVYNEDGSWNRAFINSSQGNRNPMLSMKYNEKKARLLRANNVLYGEYSILPELKYRTTFSYDFNYSKGTIYDDPRTSNGEKTNGLTNVSIYEYNKWLLSNSASYVKTFANKHYIDAIVAFDVEDYSRDFVLGESTNFIDPNLPAIGNGSIISAVDGNQAGWRMASLVSRVNYNYESKYNLGVSYRYDGSSRLSATNNNRWAGFYSVSGSWRITEENFMAECRNILSDLRLRASYGTSGNLPNDYYGYYGLSSLNSQYMGGAGITSTQVANSDLTWEKNGALNIGLDIQFLKRFGVSVEYYNRKTKDMLMDYPISYTTGFGTYKRNIGSLQNQGFEVEISTLNYQTKDFTWTTRLNAGQNKNKILKWDGEMTEMIEGTFIRRVGQDYYTYYLVEFGGVDVETGEAMFVKNTKDADGNIIDKSLTNKFSEASKIEHKGAAPTLSGGLSNNLTYKIFDLSFQFNFSTGGYSYDKGSEKTETGGGKLVLSIPTYYANSWQKPGDVTDIERYVANRSNNMADQITTRKLHPLDYLRLQNLTFGINAPKAWLTKTDLTNVRLYFAATNLLTWASYDYYDPTAIQTNGYVDFNQPPLKTLTFGIDIKF